VKQETVDLFRRHGVKQETQAGFNILTVDTTVFLISHAAAVIDDAEKHQCGRALARPQPQGFLDFLQIGRTQVELPAIVTVFGLCRRVLTRITTPRWRRMSPSFPAPPGGLILKRRQKISPSFNADREYAEGKNQNKLRPEDIEKIDFVFTQKRDLPKYSRLVDKAEIVEKHDYNLNIRRYVDNTPEPEPEDVQAHLRLIA